MPAAGPESADPPLVSVVIPAWQAADTLPETLQSLCSQTLRQWEAIVVDDGSTDGTAAAAEHAARRDSRIRVVRGPHAGVGAARNRGLAEARAPWLLFLDADDWLEPTHLERTTGATGPDVGAVVCGFARVAADGTRGEGILPSWADDPFPAFAGSCRGTTHAYVARRDLVEEVGAFDPALVICEDWDLWHRIARSGARFVAVPEILALYRMRRGSATSDARRFVADAFEVLRRVHAPDPRVRRPGRHAAGMPAEELPRRRLLFMAWVAGTVVGAGGDPSSLLDLLSGAPAADADPSWLAEALFEAVPVGAARTARAWPQLWPSIATRLSAFLDALDERSSGPSLAVEVRRSLERLVIDSADDRPLTIGSTHAVRLEVTEPVTDVVTPPDTDRLHVDVEIETAPVGLVELPVVNRRVTAAVLADSIAAAHAWPILGRFFSQTIYDGTADDSEARHDEVGWTVFLRELWGRSTWEGDAFYDPTTPDDPGTRAQPQAGWLVVEVADELPAVGPGIGHLSTVVEVGGTRIALLRLDTRAGRTAQELRAAISTACGFELCVVAVREGVLGAPLTDSLRDRLSAAAHARRSGSARGSPDRLAPNSARVVAEATGDRTPTLVLASHPGGAVGSAASRRAVLPSAATPALSQLAARAGQPSLRGPDATSVPARVVYAPDLLWSGLPTDVGPPPAGAAERSIRHEFETVFAAQTEPWRYSSEYEQVKYAQTLGLLPPRRPRRALEIGCAEGHFTELLARRVTRLLATDISEIALRRAQGRCAGDGRVEFRRLDLSTEPVPGTFDLIVCSETLYYTADRPGLPAIAAKLAAGIDPGGHLLMAHAHAVVDDPDQGGFDWDVPFGAAYIGETFGSTPGLRLVRELRTPMYRIQLYRRRKGLFARRRGARLEECPVTSPPEPDIAAHFLPSGGVPLEPAPPPVTDRLPILMYHRVAASGPPGLARHRVTPAAFDEQLAYLRDAGFRGVTVEEWGDALRRRRPLPGRCVLITFDDGYVDFLTNAWPLLRRYGFPATLFVATAHVGGTNAWDQAYGETVALLDWSALRDLRDEGVRFGAHGWLHRRLAGLSPAQIAEDGARSRAVLEDQLQEPVTAAAYPHGSHDPVVTHLFAGCGYLHGLTCNGRRSSLREHPLAMSRVEILGRDDLPAFIARLSDLPVAPDDH
jgi:peptidoglycan/xylan/chitin deacetylase (PgdA/CDA1 family)/GT2 family glycosyltransferase/SAM-dependent methyltransferase